LTRYLLDTHAFLWWHEASPQLGPRAMLEIANSTNEIFFSAISCYEMEFKRNLGKLRAPDHLEYLVNSHGFLPLPVVTAHAELAGRLPMHHRDPFDRILVAQATIENLVLVTADANIRKFDVPIMSTRY